MKNVVLESRIFGVTVGLIVFGGFLFVILKTFDIAFLLSIIISILAAFVSLLIGCLAGEHWLNYRKKGEDDNW